VVKLETLSLSLDVETSISETSVYFYKIRTPHLGSVGRERVVGMATCYGLAVRGVRSHFGVNKDWNCFLN